MLSMFLTYEMYLSFFFFFCVLPRASYVYSMGSFPVRSGGFLIIFQLFRCRNLASNRMFSYIRGQYGGCQLRGNLYAPYICMPLYIQMPTYNCMPHTPSTSACFPEFPICHGDLGGTCTLHVSWGLGGISTSVRHLCVCQYIHLPLNS